MRKTLLFAALVLAAGGWPAVAWPQAGRTLPPTPVIVSKAAAVTEAPKLAYTGVMEPFIKAQVSADVAGRVTSINHRVGDDVKRGQIMVRLTNPSLELELDVIKAHVRQGEAVVAQARQKLARTRELFEKNLAPAETYEDLAAAYQVSLAGLESTKAQKHELQERLAMMTIRSPIDGEVVRTELEIGQWVSSSAVLFEVYNYSQFELQVGVPGKYMDRIAAGSPVDIVVSEIDRRLTGRVVAAVRHVSAQSGKFVLRVQVDNPHNDFLSGLLAEVQVPLAKIGGALSVPRDAIIRRGGLSQVVVVRDGTAHVVNVQIAGDLGDAVLVESEGLKLDEQVVVRGNERLFSGMKVLVAGSL